MNEAFKKRRGRIGALTVVLAALFLLIALRLAALVVFDGPRLTSLAHTEHTGEIALAAPRGPLADRNGEPLALSAETRSVYARPAQLLPPPRLSSARRSPRRSESRRPSWRRSFIAKRHSSGCGAICRRPRGRRSKRWASTE